VYQRCPQTVTRISKLCTKGAVGSSTTCVIFFGPQSFAPWHNTEKRLVTPGRADARYLKLSIFSVILAGDECLNETELPCFLRLNTGLISVD
jgi:hypothetical protein